MLINEVCARTGLTRKAVYYYIEQGLLSPAARENGYREFSDDDTERLMHIGVLRRLGLNVGEIHKALADDGSDVLRRASLERRLNIADMQRRQQALARLADGADYADVSAELDALDEGRHVIDRLMDAFPGCYGRFLALHFAPFLGQPIANAEQRAAYDAVVAWLDGAPELPAELRDWLDSGIKTLDDSSLEHIAQGQSQAIEAPVRFMDEHADMIEKYMALLASEEYRTSPAYRLKQAMAEFCRTSGYWDVFIPALERLSPEYARYQQKLKLANDAMLKRYPQAAELTGPGRGLPSRQ